MSSPPATGLVAAAAAIALVAAGCEPPPIRIVHHVPPGARALPPLAPALPFEFPAPGGRADDPYAWLERGRTDAIRWTEQQLDFSRTYLSAIPIGNRRAKLLALGAPPWRITELRAGGDALFYVLPDGTGGATAPAHLMISSPAPAPAEVFSVEQPVSVRPSPDGKVFALGRSGVGPSRTIVLFDRDKYARLGTTIQHALASSVVWTPDSKAFYYVAYPAGGDVPAVLRHALGDSGEVDRPVFGAATFGRNQVAKGDEIAIAVGAKTITVALHSRSAVTLFTTSLAAAGTTDPAWRDVTPPPSFDAPLAHGDSLLLVPRAGAKSTTSATDPLRGPSASLMRVDLNQAAPAEPLGNAGAPILTAAEAEDGVYVIRDGRVVHLALPGGQEDALDLPGDLRAVALEASPFVPGARAFFSSCTGGGWYAFRPGDRVAHKLALDPRVAESASLETRVLPSKDVTVLARRGLAGSNHPTVLFPHACGTFSPELGPWLDDGGVAAFCDVHPIRGATTPADVVEGRKRQAAELQDCARALVDAKIATPATIGIRAAGDDGLVVLAALVANPRIAKAVAIGHGLFDARRPARPELLPEYQVRDTEDHAALAASVPYLRVTKSLPPMLLVISPNKENADSNWQSFKLAARLEAARPDDLAALVVQPKEQDDGRQGPLGDAAVIADVDAFMWSELSPRGEAAAPAVFRADETYATQHGLATPPAP